MSRSKIVPKGFKYLEKRCVLEKYKILDYFIKNPGDFTELVEFPPLAFLDHFKKSSHITEGRVYSFKDKKGRDLVLTPDSLVHLFDYFLSQDHRKNKVRYSWISPTFRYRNMPNRHGNQIGYSSINYSDGEDLAELFLGLKTLRDFVHKTCSEKIKLKIINPTLIFEILNSKLENMNEAEEIFYKIRSMGKGSRVEFIKSTLPVNINKVLLEIFDSKDTQTSLYNYNGFQQILNLFKILSKEPDFNLELDLDNLHSSEILSGIGFIIQINGKSIGDGGIYSSYGNRYDYRIKRIVSICTGINSLMRIKSID